MQTLEIVTFTCHQNQLTGILHRPKYPAKRGVLLVVGGPQYRIGSHRQFFLIARALADSGIPVLRFDYRGMGDSEGEPRDFEQIGEDIRAAIDVFFQFVSDLNECVIWGLCDAASAAMFYARYDDRVMGMVLVNPWVRTEAGKAKSYLRYYYTRRLIDPVFWRTLCTGKVNVFDSVKSLIVMFHKAFSRNHSQAGTGGNDIQGETSGTLPERMYNGINDYSGRVLIILSTNDLTAGEFKDTVDASTKWQTIMQRETVERRDLQDANHTFSRRDWRDQVINWTRDWVKSW